MQNGEVLGVILGKRVEIFFNILPVSSCSTFREEKKSSQCTTPVPVRIGIMLEECGATFGSWSDPCPCPAPASL